MLPSLLTRDIQTGLKQYILNAYEPSDGFFRGIIERFLERDGAWLKGPYLQIGLPFRLGAKGRDYFAGFHTVHKGFTHQEVAWERLKNAGSAANTLVATGTGSGKTECFLYPLLEHCARESASGNRGVKALIIYPMNALASDQSRRIAEMIHTIPAFKNVRVGLYVGGVTTAGGGTIMTPASVITDRETLRNSPPDILLTNYKMLDFLLIRPRDRELWSKNSPDTLRYIVVDELHTFDGAQGTDLALLLRRLKARLKAPEGAIAHIGTSATLGGSLNTKPLCDYARQVFASPFPPESVVTENRLNIAEFLGDQPAEYILEPRPDLAKLLDRAGYHTPEAAISAWFSLFFPEEPPPSDVSDPLWRQNLGRLLKRHFLFTALIKTAERGAVSLADVQASLGKQVVAPVRVHLGAAIDALLALVAWARSTESPELPFVTLRVQIWLREMRRMVAPLVAQPSELELRTASELPSDTNLLWLPLIRCAECHTTAWVSRVANLGDDRLTNKLDDIYMGWFGGNAEMVRLYPLVEAGASQAEGIVQFACMDCHALGSKEDECSRCSGSRLVRVFRTSGQKTVKRGDSSAVYHDSTCPLCGASNTMILIGSRSTTLGAQIVEQSWSSLYNDDRKLIAFSDSVQDAAHRAGFFSARTYIHTVRKAVAQGIDYLVDGSMPWSEFRQKFDSLWQDSESPLYMNEGRFVAEFIGPNMTWQRAWTDLYHEGGQLPRNSPLVGRVQKRLGWQAFAEFTYAGNRGSNLERIGVATLAPSVSDVDKAARTVQSSLREQFGVKASREVVFWWLWGFIIHLRRRGAMYDAGMGTYPEDGDLWKLTKTTSRQDWMPKMGRSTAHPVFFDLGRGKDFDHIVVSGRRTWYNQWLEATIAQETTLLPNDRVALYQSAITALEAIGLVKVYRNGNIISVGLKPERMHLFTELLRLQNSSETRSLIVPADTATRLMEMPCLDAPKDRYETIKKPARHVAERLQSSALRRVITAEHTGLLEREERESLERRFKSKAPQPWYENLLSATPTLEMGVDIGDLSSVMLCTVPPTVAGFLQRVGRAGRRDGNAHTTTLADGASPHDLYFFEEPSEMMAGDVAPPGIFLQAPEVLRRQFCAFCLDDWVSTHNSSDALPDKTREALDAIDAADMRRFPHNFIEHIKKNRHQLFEAFIDLLGDNADEEVHSRLLGFVEGREDIESLPVRLLSALTELSSERKQYSARIKELRSQIKKLKAKPSDEATVKEIGDLGEEESKFQELVAEINGRELLNTLTDVGLIPNYAFPEAGVELKSILWRRSTDEDKTASKFISLPALRYERPAASALSEFAPDNRFYANQRQVVINQINMDIARLEDWRLCPNCHHMENLEKVADAHPVCPHCGDTMWSDSGQRRLLLRFRQAIANSDDTNVRIDDSAEEREPTFYVRQMLVDFAPQDIREAWMLSSEGLPFGFEFIASATFRDVNFGEGGKNGEKFKVADQEQLRPGFRLCRRCGRVQPDTKPPQIEPDPNTRTHAPDCGALKNPLPDDIIQCLYLYREFQSEALRILVPFTRLGVDDEVVQSFSAAFQLGLKRRFGGQVDHLRVVFQETPDPDGGNKRRYLLIYDSVPGGTGYLHQLLAHDARTLKEVFQMALEALQQCPCQMDPAKDGCYRCVYQYRLGRSMQLVSRRTALAVMDDLVGSLHGLERTETISGIGLNSALESVLERRFIESLRRLSRAGGLPQIIVIQEIVNGREGYHLQVGDYKYSVELQADLNHEQGVKRASRPDFLIRPLSSALKRKPIAVFCDGWTYHKEKLRDDAAKRTAILNCGRYWVWSVVMEDVEAAVQGKAGAVLEPPYQLQEIPAPVPKPAPTTFTRNSVAELLHWLSTPANEADSWVNNAWAASMCWLLQLVPRTPAVSAEVQSLNSEIRANLPLWIPAMPPNTFDAGKGGGNIFDIRGAWAQQVHMALNRTERVPNIIWFDDVSSLHDSDRHQEWRWWLWAFNWFQASPGTMLVTRTGVLGRDYDTLNPRHTLDTESGATVTATGGEGWEECISQLLTALVDEARMLAAAGCPVPEEIGFSLVSETGEELSMAEMAWVELKIALLVEDYRKDKGAWELYGWQVFVAEPDWASRIKALLFENDEVNR